MDYDTVQVDTDTSIATITLNRPNRLNSFSLSLGKELYHVLKQVGTDPHIRVVIIKGAGKAFCGGGDVKEMNSASNKSQYLKDLTKAIHRCVLEIRQMEKPVIAVVHGAAMGAGLSFMIACDIIVAVKGTRFNTAFINMGLAPGCGTYFISRLVGYQRACELVLLAKEFSTDEALDMGIINYAAETDNIENVVEKLIQRFHQLPPLAIGMAKTLLNESLCNDLISHLEQESYMAALSAGTHDFKEAVQAFVEKRPPHFTGV